MEIKSIPICPICGDCYFDDEYCYRCGKMVDVLKVSMVSVNDLIKELEELRCAIYNIRDDEELQKRIQFAFYKLKNELKKE